MLVVKTQTGIALVALMVVLTVVGVGAHRCLTQNALATVPTVAWGGGVRLHSVATQSGLLTLPTTRRRFGLGQERARLCSAWVCANICRMQSCEAGNLAQIRHTPSRGPGGSS